MTNVKETPSQALAVNTENTATKTTKTTKKSASEKVLTPIRVNKETVKSSLKPTAVVSNIGGVKADDINAETKQRAVKNATTAAKSFAKTGTKPVIKAAAKYRSKLPTELSEKPPSKSAKKLAEKTKLDKPQKAKLVRDSFTIPKAEYLVLDALKLRANQLTKPVKKSELLRAGIKALAAFSDAAFLNALAKVPAIKTGRPARE
jgi:hypothetical protein